MKDTAKHLGLHSYQCVENGGLPSASWYNPARV